MNEDTLSREDLVDFVRSYIVRQVRELSPGHDELFEHGLNLYGLVEDEVLADTKGAKKRVAALKEHRLARRIIALLPKRARRILDAAIVGMEDNRNVMEELVRLIDETGATDRTEVEELYRRALTSQVPRARSLENVSTIADSSELVHEVLTTKSFFTAMLRDKGYGFVRSVLIRKDEIRDEVDRLYEILRADPSELLVLAATVREHGPAVIHEIYGE